VVCAQPRSPAGGAWGYGRRRRKLAERDGRARVDADYHATFAALLVQLKQYPDAVRQYKQALEMQPGPGTWWVGLGLALAAQGKNDEARSAYRRARMAGNLPDTLEEFVRAKLAD